MKFWLPTRPQNQARKLAILEDYFEEKEEQQQQPTSAEVAITMAREINPAVCVLAAKERAQCARVLWVVPSFAEYHTKVNL